MPEKEMSSLERINMIGTFLDNLVDAKGRAKCGYISIIDDFLNKIKDDIILKDTQIQDLLKEVNKKDETISQE